MVRTPFHPVAQVEIAILPDKRVRTLDGKQVRPGMKLYHKYTPEEASEYEVLLDTAFQDPYTKEWQVIMLGPRLPVMSRSVSLFVADLGEWADFYARRHQGERPELVEVPPETSTRKRRRRRRKTSAGNDNGQAAGRPQGEHG